MGGWGGGFLSFDCCSPAGPPSLLSSSLLAAVVGGLAASSAMLSPVVQTVVQMGFDAALVESLVQTKYLLSGQQYTSVSDLVSDVLQAEQEEGQRAPQSRGKRNRNLVSRAARSGLAR